MPLQYLPANTPSPEGFVYQEDRVFTDAQSWWLDTDLPFPGKHTHVGAYFPFLKEVKGDKLPMHFLCKMHYNPGLATAFRVQIWGQVDPAFKASIKFESKDGVKYYVETPFKTTPALDGDGVWFHVDVPLTGMKNDGRYEFRCTLNIPKTPAGVSAGNRQYNTTRWHAIVKNGKPYKDAGESVDRMGAAGWYTGVEYSNTAIKAVDGLKLFYGAPVKAGDKVTVRGEFPELFVGIDTKPHTEDKGIVLYEGTGSKVWKTVTFPSGLTPGLHRLYIRTTKNGTSPKGTGSGAWFIPFVV